MVPQPVHTVNDPDPPASHEIEHRGVIYTVQAAHPEADRYPWLTGDDLQELADDIKANGLRRKIVRFEGKVLDGRNRYVACLMSGAEPEFEDFAGDELAAINLVVSENIHRRNLTKSQRAILVATFTKLYAELQSDAEARQSSQGPRGAEGGRGNKKERGETQTPPPQMVEGFSESEIGIAGASQSLTPPAGFAELGVSQSIIAKLATLDIQVADVLDYGPELGQIGFQAGLSKVQVIELERCVEDWRAGRTRQPSETLPRRKKDAGETAVLLGKTADVGKTYVRAATRLVQESPAVAQEVLAGKKTLTRVAREERVTAGGAAVADYQRKLSALAHRIAEGDGAASTLIRVQAYLDSLIKEDGKQTRLDLAKNILCTLIPELQQAGTRLIINVNK